MKKKKRKVKVFRLFIVCILLLLIIGSLVFLFVSLTKKEEVPFNVNDLTINEIDYSEASTLPLDLYSKEYLLIRLNDFKVLYAKDSDKKIYPASLTKVLTLDAVLDNCNNISNFSSFTQADWNYLVEQNASLAGLKIDTDYSIKDLLYALVLPSGADAAVCLDHYLVNTANKDIVSAMNEVCEKLNLKSSHFTNPTGLHDDDLYTSLDDYAKIVIDVLLKKDGKEVLKTAFYSIDNEIKCYSTLKPLFDRDDDIKVYGGKTGFTYEAGMNIMALYEADNRSYLLILANAPGSPYSDGQRHIDDVNKIFDFLYNN